jgi:hypothetical protein
MADRRQPPVSVRSLPRVTRGSPCQGWWRCGVRVGACREEGGAGEASLFRLVGASHVLRPTNWATAQGEKIKMGIQAA